MSIQRWKDMWYGEDHGELLPREDGEYVLYADHVAEVSQVRLDAVCDQMDHDSRCIADGHRGNGTYERDYVCQVCQEIMCDDDCPVSVARDRVEAMRAACIAAVEAHMHYRDCDCDNCHWIGINSDWIKEVQP